MILNVQRELLNGKTVKGLNGNAIIMVLSFLAYRTNLFSFKIHLTVSR